MLKNVSLSKKGQKRGFDSCDSASHYRITRTTALSSLIFLGLLIAVIFHYGVGSIQGSPWPKNSFLYEPVDRFNDLVNSIICVRDWNPYCNNDGRAGLYFPFAYFCLLPFTAMPITTVLWSFIISAVISFFLLIVWWCRMRFADGERFLASRDLSLAFLISYPFLFALDRGNLDLWVGALVLLFLIALRRGKWGIGVAVVALAAASALKGYPALFILLFILERRYMAAMAVLGTAALFTCGSLAVFDGDFAHNWSGFRAGLQIFHDQFVVGPASLHYFVDPYNGIRFLLGNTEMVRHLCGGFAFIFLLISSFYVLFVPVPIWRKTLAIGITLLIFPIVANDYKLLILLPGILEFVSVNEPMRFREKAVLVLTALLLIPKHYYFFSGGHVSVSCVASPVIVLLISLALFVDPSAWRSAFCSFADTLSFYWEPILRMFRSSRRQTVLMRAD